MEEGWREKKRGKMRKPRTILRPMGLESTAVALRRLFISRHLSLLQCLCRWLRLLLLREGAAGTGRRRRAQRRVMPRKGDPEVDRAADNRFLLGGRRQVLLAATI